MCINVSGTVLDLVDIQNESLHEVGALLRRNGQKHT